MKKSFPAPTMGSLASCVLLLCLILTSSCGYTNLYHTNNGTEPITLYRDMWQNRTNELGLEATLYHTLSTWLRKSRIISLQESAINARYHMKGTITSFDFPEVAYGTNGLATELRARLGVFYTITDTETNSIVLEKKMIYTETFHPHSNANQLQTNKKEALESIADDISEDIYLYLMNTVINK